MARFHVVLSHGYRLPIAYCKADVICITQITLKEIYKVLLIDNGRFRFFSFKLIVSLILWLVKTGCTSRSTKITQSRPQLFFGQRLNNLQHAALLTSFWRHRLNNLAPGCTFDVIDSIWRSFFPNLVNSSWLWWIMRVVSTYQKRGSILNE